jgi:hypothetical protein
MMVGTKRQKSSYMEDETNASTFYTLDNESCPGTDVVIISPNFLANKIDVFDSKQG